jgi:SAM-dependent methyltransferase
MKIKIQTAGEEASYYKREFETKGLEYRTNEWNNNRKTKLLNLLGVFSLKESRVLDFGCGTAAFTPYLKKSFENVIGLDVAWTNLKIAKNIDRTSKYICGDGNGLPFKDETFDAVFCGATLHHFPDIVEPLKEINRILKTNGILFAAEPNAWNPLSFIQYQIKRARRSGNPLTWEEHSFFGYVYIKRKLSQSGFIVLRRRGMNFTPPEVKGIWKFARVIEPYLESLPLINMLGGSLLITAKKVKKIR